MTSNLLKAIPLVDISDVGCFEEIFKNNFNKLRSFAFIMTQQSHLAEEIVQNVFLKLWEKKETIKVENSITSYLYKSVRNDCLNHIAHENIKLTHRSHSLFQSKQNNTNGDADHKVIFSQLEKAIRKAIDQLPAQCRLIFELSRFENKKNREIAELLDISIKTVENQMGKALKILRAELIDYLPFLLLILSCLN